MCQVAGGLAELRMALRTFVALLPAALAGEGLVFCPVRYIKPKRFSRHGAWQHLMNLVAFC